MGLLLSICCPDFSAIPSLPCLGKTGGRRPWACACAGEDLWASAAWLDCMCTAKWWLLEPFLVDNCVEWMLAVQRGPDQRHLSALPICTARPPHFQPAPHCPHTNFWSTEQNACACLVGGSHSCLWKRCFPHFPPPPSLPPAFSHCHFSLD